MVSVSWYLGSLWSLFHGISGILWSLLAVFWFKGVEVCSGLARYLVKKEIGFKDHIHIHTCRYIHIHIYIYMYVCVGFLGSRP